MNYRVYAGLCLALYATQAYAENFCLVSEALDDHISKVTITIALEPQQVLFKDSLNFSVDNPAFVLSPWESNKPPLHVYDSAFKDTKLSYNDTVSFTLTVTRDPAAHIDHVRLFMHYLLSNEKHPQEKSFSLSFTQPTVSPDGTGEQPGVTNVISAQSSRIVPPSLPQSSITTALTPQALIPLANSIFSTFLTSFGSFFKNLKYSLSLLVEKTDSLAIRLALVLLLGLLMSFTPCIYPMIPITVGILQATPGQSVGKNILIALSYTFGIGTTFAILGLLASYGGTQFGQLLGNPIFVIILVAFLAYLGLSMFGFYEIYIPRLLQTSHVKTLGGPFLSAFLFGAVSGTVASPCLSPGLALVLTIVANMGNIVLGFLLLFAFGVGSSLPLLIIGTFSNSVHLLPRAGSWMVEVKKLFGLMLIGMCFYYLSAIIAWYKLLWAVALFLFLMGIYYSITIAPHDSRLMKHFKHATSVLFVVSSCMVALYAYKATHKATYAEPSHEHGLWLTDYQVGLKLALEQQKKLLLDFGASWCTSCTELDKKVLQDPAVQDALSLFVPVKIDCTNVCTEADKEIQKHYGVRGFPTLILVDPVTQKTIEQWGSELLDLPQEQFIKVLKSLQ